MNPDDTMRTEWALVQLNNAFAYYRDNGPVESMMELFTEDARIERAGTALRGHQELRDFLQERAKNTTRHLLTNFHFTDVDENSAAGVVCALVYEGPPSEVGGPVVQSSGRVVEFHDSYVKSGDAWRIASRAARHIFTPEISA